ncbi:MAG: hypothetical protein HKN85_05610, partial [Gammaproteobacteria bacterium]|nr:hypothetical protein [Gammaproteobacteria bacterium]
DWGGNPSWLENKQDRQRGLPRVIPVQYQNFPGDVTWDEYEKLLVSRGVKDPVFPASPEYCQFGDSADIPLEPTSDDNLPKSELSGSAQNH